MKSSAKPTIILVNPQMQENIGFAARAMRNCELNNLVVVSNKIKKFSSKSIACAASGEDILQQAKICPNFQTGVGKLKYLIATTGRPRELNLPVFELDDFVAQLPKLKINLNEIGVVFGCERTGLDNETLSKCNAILTIPAAQDYSSFNLAQSVLLVAHAFFKQGDKHTFKNKNDQAHQAELLKFFEFLHEHLREYYKIPQKTEQMRHNLQNIFNRAQISSKEIKSLYGMFKNLK